MNLTYWLRAIARMMGERPTDINQVLATNFDDLWYNERYQLTDAKLNGLAHYLSVGIDAGHSPNSNYNEAYYLSANPDVAEAKRKGEWRCGYEHFVRFGRHEMRAAMPRDALMSGRNWSYLSVFFDDEWYNNEYGLTASEPRGFNHYLGTGAKAGLSPNPNFDEQFYRSFYQDIAKSLRDGRFISGFEHYVVSGRFENRLPKFSAERALDCKFPGITSPVGVHVADAIAARIRSLPARKGHGRQTVWFLLPTLNPDIFFGGYKSVLELIRAFVERGKAVNIVICNDNDDGVYGLWRLRNDPIVAALRAARIFCRANLETPLSIGPNDRIVAYSTWEAHLAHELARLTDQPEFALLVQEYEAIFHEHGPEHAMVSAAYNLPHFAIFNTEALRRYYESNRLGIYARLAKPRRGTNYALFEHVLTRLPPPTTEDLRTRGTRRFVLYARPEQHANRNLFALALSALRNMVEDGRFDEEWEFHGIGALQKGTIRLGRATEMTLHSKFDEPDYRRFMQSIDLGLSLMYAPHPGLVAYEMASVGARVVTNVYENRSAAQLRAISENIYPCEPSIAGIEDALCSALRSVGDIASRERGMRLRREGTPKPSWADAFDDLFFETELGSFLGSTETRWAQAG